LIGQASAAERDPFALPAGIQKKSAQKDKGAAGPETGAKESIQLFRVTTILVSGRTRVAAINGRIMREGEEIGGYRIQEISEQQVLLSRAKEKMVLKMEPGTGYIIKKSKTDPRVMGLSK
jgi:hypothetical protein